ncbi:hypothetical protein FIBSPDRAFT_896809 [Athelia psychrophila]|uniref:Uncharacterized protein n=1 Tax=Athelia psychrophila TaxID=1759441 RepID=A0A166D067_9AGAM|nr:hypothetical protein FIBSPDRAFT_896809 [Fibularhizoctonia sp. CBS 109695]
MSSDRFSRAVRSRWSVPLLLGRSWRAYRARWVLGEGPDRSYGSNACSYRVARSLSLVFCCTLGTGGAANAGETGKWRRKGSSLRQGEDRGGWFRVLTGIERIPPSAEGTSCVASMTAGGSGTSSCN